MRDIKFRGWHEPSKSMVSPDGHFIEFDGSIWFNCGDYHDQLTSQEDVILMQFTGLQDRNGKDIYEGDILTDKWKAEVYFKNGSFWISSKPSINADSYLHGFIKSREQAKCPVEIIGNIHENPELLEKSA